MWGNIIYSWRHRPCIQTDTSSRKWKETRKILSKQLYFTSKGTRKRTKPKVSKKKKIIKVRVEINEIETKIK